MEITEVRITLRNEDKLKAFANITFDDEFVVRGLKVISGNNGYFVSMPSRKREDGTHQDVAHPINNQMRKRIEESVLAAYEEALKEDASKYIMVKANPMQAEPRQAAQASGDPPQPPAEM